MVAGFLALPFDAYLWRLLGMVIILIVGFVLNALGLVGGGDAKYAAAIAPFFSGHDLRLIVLLFAVMLIAAFVIHRTFRRIPFIRRLTPDWKSWDAGKDFPMGLALSGTLIAYLALAL